MASPILDILSAALSVGGGLFGGQKETPIQGQQRNIIELLMQGLSGEGPFADLFKNDEAFFQKSYVEPALSQFENKIAPQIQQQFIQSGLQRGSGLDSALTQAGIDMNQLLSQLRGQMQQGAQNRASSAISHILGQNAGVPEQSLGEKLGQSLAGYASGQGARQTLENLFQPRQRQTNREGVAG